MPSTPKTDWAYNDLVTPNDMNEIGSNLQEIFTPDLNAATLSTNQTITSNGTWQNLTESAVELTIDTNQRVRLDSVVCVDNSTTSVVDITLRYANTNAPTTWYNVANDLFGSDTMLVRHRGNVNAYVHSYPITVLTGVLTPGTYRFIIALKAASGTVRGLSNTTWLVAHTV